MSHICITAACIHNRGEAQSRLKQYRAELETGSVMCEQTNQSRLSVDEGGPLDRSQDGVFQKEWAIQCGCTGQYEKN